MIDKQKNFTWRHPSTCNSRESETFTEGATSFFALEFNDQVEAMDSGLACFQYTSTTTQRKTQETSFRECCSQDKFTIGMMEKKFLQDVLDGTEMDRKTRNWLNLLKKATIFRAFCRHMRDLFHMPA